MLDIIRGADKKNAISSTLISELKDIFNKDENEGLFYIGYPILNTNNGGLLLDAVLVTPEHGLVAFDLFTESEYESREKYEDQLYAYIQSKLIQCPGLMINRSLGVNVEVLTYAPQFAKVRTVKNFITSHDLLMDKLKEIKNSKGEINTKLYNQLLSVIQVVSNLKNSRKRKAEVNNSRGSKLKMIEAGIATLDTRQNRAVIETVNGPQRIRGLAGSGKTIILALKAAYLHSTYPDWKIAVTFNTRSLKKQFYDLITKFTIEQSGEEPNWDNIKIMQSWGSQSSLGLYYEFCISNQMIAMDFSTANFGSKNKLSPLGFACKAAMEHLKKKGVSPVEKYDAILIDEAQDLSPYFLKVCYSYLKEPKRIIWAYDELQNLGSIKMQTPMELFGVELASDVDSARGDIILNKCYRNSLPVLVSAHGLGFGTSRKDGLVQIFGDHELWNDIGYIIEDGNLEFGSNVTLSRTQETSPEILQDHSSIDDIITVKTFKDNIEQCKWVVDEIQKNITDDELCHKDIVVISLNPLTTKDDTLYLRTLLLERNINNHLAGVTTSPDNFFEEDSIAVTGIFRAKGNEAPMVYIINSQYAYSGLELIKKRNILFSAITRSKAWVRVLGFGDGMNELKSEFDKIKDDNFKLKFKYPTEDEFRRISTMNRELTPSEIKKKTTVLNNINQIITDMSNGVISIDEIDESLREGLIRSFKKNKDE